MEKSKHTAVVLVPGSSGFDTLTAPHPDKLKIKRIGNLCLPFPSAPGFDLPLFRLVQDPDGDDDSSDGGHGHDSGGAAAARSGDQRGDGDARGGSSSSSNRRWQEQGGRAPQWVRRAASNVADRVCDKVIQQALSKLITDAIADPPLTLCRGMYRPRNIRSLAFDEVWSLSLLRAK